ncbi:MAG: GTPase Era [Woeseiaceae bacterium]
MPERIIRCGFVAVVGRPNVGKSTLINAILGSKVSIVTPKPQTTRHRILAVYTRNDSQIIFVDTPGLHRGAAKTINRMMNRTAASALADADLILFVSEANRWTTEDQDVLDRLKESPVPAIALLNKIDKVHPKEELLSVLSAMSERHTFGEVLPISAKLHDNLDRLVELIPAYLPESPALYPEEMITDRSESFQIAELIREKLTLLLRQEVPYGLTVEIEQIKKEPEGVGINAIIWVERDSQKGIVVGKGGNVLKKVGRSARLELKERLGMPVHLELWVKVKDNWADSERELLRLGYE